MKRLYGFLSPLEVREVSDTRAAGRGTWRLLKPLRYRSRQTNSVYIVPAGFVTDFASVPRIPGVFDALGDTAHPAATLHDWLYTAHPVDRATADDLLFEAAVAEGVPRWRAWLLWAGVRVFGASHWRTP